MNNLYDGLKSPYNPTFPRKGYGKIFVEKEEDIKKVEDIIKAMDEYEFDYMPENMISVFSEDAIREYVPTNPSSLDKYSLGVKTVYTHKFDSLDLNLLQLICWRNGIHIFCWHGQGYYYEHI